MVGWLLIKQPAGSYPSAQCQVVVSESVFELLSCSMESIPFIWPQRKKYVSAILKCWALKEVVVNSFKRKCTQLALWSVLWLDSVGNQTLPVTKCDSTAQNLVNVITPQIYTF